jgi:hypothetical protein
MAEKNQLSEQESLQLITEMIQKAKNSFHESGMSAILWGTAVGTAGLVDFAERKWGFDIGFDIWLLVLAAFIPQIIITVRERRNRKVRSYQEVYMDAVLLVFGVGIFMLNFYLNVISRVTDNMWADQGKELLLRNNQTGEIAHYIPSVPSGFSLLLLVFAMPTLMMGIGSRFKPMIFGGIICFGFFLISCFTTTTWDMLLCGLSGITNWLVPGLCMRYRYLKGKNC